MKVKIVIVIIVVGVIALLFLQYNLIRNQPKKISNEELLQSIELLDNKIDSLKNHKDSIQLIIDTTKVKIVEVEKKYETIRNHIITQSTDSDCITFANYISNYSGFISNNNSTATKSN